MKKLLASIMAIVTAIGYGVANPVKAEEWNTPFGEPTHVYTIADVIKECTSKCEKTHWVILVFDNGEDIGFIAWDEPLGLSTGRISFIDEGYYYE